MQFKRDLNWGSTESKGLTVTQLSYVEKKKKYPTVWNTWSIFSHFANHPVDAVRPTDDVTHSKWVNFISGWSAIQLFIAPNHWKTGQMANRFLFFFCFFFFFFPPFFSSLSGCLLVFDRHRANASWTLVCIQHSKFLYHFHFFF